MSKTTCGKCHKDWLGIDGKCRWCGSKERTVEVSAQAVKASGPYVVSRLTGPSSLEYSYSPPRLYTVAHRSQVWP